MSNLSEDSTQTLQQRLQAALDRLAELEKDVDVLEAEQAAESISPPPAPPRWAPPPLSPEEALFPILPLVIILVLVFYACCRLGVPLLMKHYFKTRMSTKVRNVEHMSLGPTPAQEEGFAGSPGVALALEEEIRQKRSTDKQRLLKQIAGLSNGRGAAAAPSPADVEEDVQWHPNTVGGLDAALSAELGSNQLDPPGLESMSAWVRRAA